MPFATDRLDDLMGAGCIASPFRVPLVLRCSGGEGGTAKVCDCVGCVVDGSLCGGDWGMGIASSSGDGIVCMFFVLVPRRSAFRCGLERFSGEGGRSPVFLSSFRLPITVPRRRSPKPRDFFSGVVAAANHISIATDALQGVKPTRRPTS